MPPPEAPRRSGMHNSMIIAIFDQNFGSVPLTPGVGAGAWTCRLLSNAFWHGLLKDNVTMMRIPQTRKSWRVSRELLIIFCLLWSKGPKVNPFRINHLHSIAINGRYTTSRQHLTDLRTWIYTFNHKSLQGIHQHSTATFTHRKGSGRECDVTWTWRKFKEWNQWMLRPGSS